MADSVEYQYDPGDRLIPHRINAKLGNETVGHLEWHGEPEDTFNHVQDVHVNPNMRRQGIATGMWKHAHHISTQFDDVASPVHNPYRTTEGDVWAKAVGGHVPTRIPFEFMK
jgi:hypothetical protein